MVGDQDADVLALQAIDDALDVLHGDGVHTGKRLIQHDEVRVDGQAAGNLGAAALATRQAVTQVLAHLLQVELADKLLQPVFLLGGSEVGHLQHGADVVLNAQGAEYRSLLRQVTHAQLGAAVNRQGSDVHIVQEHASLVGGDKARGHVEGRGLTGTVGPQQPHDFALMHIDRHVVDHGALAVFFHQVVGAEHKRALVARRLQAGHGSFVTGLDTGLALVLGLTVVLPGQFHYFLFVVRRPLI